MEFHTKLTIVLLRIIIISHARNEILVHGFIDLLIILKVVYLLLIHFLLSTFNMCLYTPHDILIHSGFNDESGVMVRKIRVDQVTSFWQD